MLTLHIRENVRYHYSMADLSARLGTIGIGTPMVLPIILRNIIQIPQVPVRNYIGGQLSFWQANYLIDVRS